MNDTRFLSEDTFRQKVPPYNPSIYSPRPEISLQLSKHQAIHDLIFPKEKMRAKGIHYVAMNMFVSKNISTINCSGENGCLPCGFKNVNDLISSRISFGGKSSVLF